MSKDYLPQGDATVVAWLTNFKAKITTMGASVGLSAADLSAIQTVCSNWTTSINTVQTKRAELAAATESRVAASATNGGQIREVVKKIKGHPAYTDALGKELGIVSSALEMDREEFKAEISAEIFGGFVRIKFVKRDTQGINLYHRKKGEANWKFLARDTKSPYDDHIELAVDGQPEHWEYRAFAVVDDLEIGQPSDIVEIVYGG